MNEQRTEAKAVAMNGAGGYFVFWQTPEAYGARGSDLTREHAEALAERIRKSGPDA